MGFEKTCSGRNCPKTHDKILNELCELWYPYGGVKCRNQFKMWKEESEEVRELHKEYLQERKYNAI